MDPLQTLLNQAQKNSAEKKLRQLLRLHLL
jgi:hypothetical protein